MRSFWIRLAILAPMVLGSGEAMAINGMNMIGYGAVSPAMGGADLAIVDNATAMNINPAGLCACTSPELGVGLGLLFPHLKHEDRLNNQTAEERIFPLPLATFASPVGEMTLTFGLGFFSQGGMGAEFDNLVTPFSAAGLAALPGQRVPGRDETCTDVAYAKLTPTLAWKRGDLSLGVSLNAGYVQTSMRYFPETSVFIDGNGDGDAEDDGEMAFAGMDLDGLHAWGYGVRVGFQYRLGAISIGGAWISETDLDFREGEMSLNLSAAGLDKVRYDATMSGFAWPRQAGLGLSWDAAPWLKLAADVDWINWSDAISEVRIRLSHPDRAQAPPSREIVIPMHWEDQWVYAVGAEIALDSRWRVRLGYNHADSPVPDTFLTPLFPAIIEDHVTAGLGWSPGRWRFDLGVEVGLCNRQENNNADLAVNPFGTGSQETHSQLVVHTMVTRVF